MITFENNTITYFLNSENMSVPLQCRFLESGFYTVAKQKKFRHPTPAFNRVFLFKSGGAEIEIGDSTYILRDHEIYLMPKNQTFTASYEVGSEFFYFHLLLEDYFGHDVFGRTRGIPAIRDRPRLFSEITDGYLAQDFEGLIAWQNALFNAVMVFSTPLLDSVSLQSFKSMKYHDLLVYLTEHCSASLRIDNLCREMGMSRAALSKAFKRDLGISLKEYMIRLLLKKAREMLVSSDMRIGEIAYNLGYEDPFYFTRIFKKYMGETPRTYRRQTCNAMTR
jgi:AraC-like DNA-binding protein